MRTKQDEYRATLKQEAIRSLQAYLKTGIEGLKAKGLDRIKALDIDASKCSTTRQEIEHLIEHVRMYA